MKLKNAIFSFLICSNLSQAYALSNEKAEEIKWAPTNMTPLFLTNTIEQKYCQHSAERFRGCVAAVDRFVKYNDRFTGLDFINDEFVIVEDKSFDQRFKNYKEYIIGKRKKLNHLMSFYSIKSTESLIKIFQQELIKKGKLKSHEIAIPVNEFNATLYDPFKTYEPIDRYNGLLQVRLPPSIGIEVSLEDNVISIDKVYVDSPSYFAGLKVDDKLIKINGKSIHLKNENELDSFFNFKNNQKVTFTVERKKEILKIPVVFSYSKYPPVVDKVINLDGIMYTYLHMKTIPSHLEPEMTCRVFKKMLTKFDNETEGLVLDLRDNPGGYGDVAACIASHLIGGKQPLFSEADILGNEVDVKESSTEKYFTKPVVVLINESTASSAEILAGVLQFHGRARIVGNQSFGKAIGQITESFSQAPGDLRKIELHFTAMVAQYPDGTTHQGSGLIPDFKVYYHGIESSKKERAALRMEDYALYPMKFERGKVSMEKIPQVDLKKECTDLKAIKERFDSKNKFSWEKDFQLQAALQVLSCAP